MTSWPGSKTARRCLIWRASSWTLRRCSAATWT
ncbi:hypothetical protein GBAR_LOCUS19812 [Geodia barretti]|uniref:Uncharacterized protein n=1 Tax=Geodia barretti TaxID=519541 RepID=A0AA35WWD8_GEOBA|nr:hypothetical protein GBAR_LOCUS19812 [Geodia barretti]